MMAGAEGDRSCCIHSREEAGRDECSALSLSFLFGSRPESRPESMEGTACIYGRSSHLNELTAGTSSEKCPGIHFHGNSKFFHIGNEE